MTPKQHPKDQGSRAAVIAWLLAAPPGAVQLHYCPCREDFVTIVTVPARETKARSRVKPKTNREVRRRSKSDG